jgi:hypothetical protein
MINNRPLQIIEIQEQGKGLLFINEEMSIVKDHEVDEVVMRCRY